MKTILSTILILCCVTLSFSQENFILPGHWVVKNHGVDYPVKDFYSFGQKPSLNDEKFIRDNRSMQFNGNRTKNGIVIVAYERVLNADSTTFELFLSDSMNNAGIPEVNGEYNFDWMLTPTEVNQTVVDQFIYFLSELPEDALVMMYSGYYHEIHKMEKPFFDAIQPFSSYEILNLESTSVWGYIGSNCGNDIPVEAATTRQDSLINITHSFRVECALPSNIGTSQTEELNVYPNPFVDRVQIDLPMVGDVEISVSNLNAEVLLETSNVQSLQLEALPRGIYILKLKNNEKVLTQRIVKQ